MKQKLFPDILHWKIIIISLRIFLVLCSPPTFLEQLWHFCSLCRGDAPQTAPTTKMSEPFQKCQSWTKDQDTDYKNVRVQRQPRPTAQTTKMSEPFQKCQSGLISFKFILISTILSMCHFSFVVKVYKNFIAMKRLIVLYSQILQILRRKPKVVHERNNRADHKNVIVVPTADATCNCPLWFIRINLSGVQ